MMYISLKHQKIKRGNKYVWVAPGDEIPEAEKWPNLMAWIKQGYIRKIKQIKKEDPKPYKAPLPAISERKRFGSKKHYRKKPKDKMKDVVSIEINEDK